MESHRIPFLSLAAFALASCSSVQWVPVPDLGVPVENPNMARVCVARPGAFHLSGVSRTILDDGVEIGVLESDGHMIWERPPGPAVIGAGGWKYLRFVGREVRSSPVDLPLELEAGRTYTLRLSPIRSKRARELEDAAPDERVAVSTGNDAWELRIVDEEEAAQLLAKTSPARFEAREIPEPERYEGPGFAFPVDPVGEQVVEHADGSGVALVDRMGHALVLEWTELPDGAELPGTYAQLEDLVVRRVPAADDTELLHVEPVQHADTLAYFVTRVAEGSSMTLSGGLFGSSEQLDALRGTLVFPRGGRLYFLTWQESELLNPEALDETTWAPWRTRLLDFLETIEFDPSADA